MFTARVQSTVPCVGSPTSTRTKYTLNTNVTISVLNAELPKSKNAHDSTLRPSSSLRFFVVPTASATAVSFMVTSPFRQRAPRYPGPRVLRHSCECVRGYPGCVARFPASGTAGHDPGGSKLRGGAPVCHG